MSLFDWFRKAPTAPERKSAPYVVVGDVGRGTLSEYLVNGSGRVSASDAARIYRTSSAVAIAVDTVADEVEKITPVLRTTNGDMITSHPLLQLLNNPNPYDIRQQFLGSMARHWLLNHDSYLSALGSFRAPPIELYATDPQLVQSNAMQDEYASTYYLYSGPVRGTFEKVLKGRDRARYLDGTLKEIYHIRGFSSRTEQSRSDSPLEAVLLEARQQIMGRYHNLRLLQNGGRLSLIAIFKDSGLGTDELAERRQWLNEQLAGADNAGKIVTVGSDDLELKEMGTSNKDMDYSTLDKVVFQTVMQRYKIPLPLVTNDASTFNNLESAVYHLYDRAVLPCYDYLAAGLSAFLLPRYGLDPSQIQISYNPESIESLVSRRLEQIKLRKDIGVETTNELRALLPGREPIEGGDTLYQPATMVPVGQDMFTEDNINTAEERARARTRERAEATAEETAP